MEPLELNDTLKVCPRFESTKNQATPSTATMKGWLLDRHGDHRELSRNLKSYNVTALESSQCGTMPEDIYFCATVEPKEVNCFGRMGNPVFTRDGMLLGFQTTQNCADCGCTTVLRIGVTDKRVQRARERTKKATPKKLLVV